MTGHGHEPSESRSPIMLGIDLPNTGDHRGIARLRRADLVRARVPPNEGANRITAHVPANAEPRHREKFVSDVLAELEYLDASRIGGLGITRQELEAWQELRLPAS